MESCNFKKQTSCYIINFQKIIRLDSCWPFYFFILLFYFLSNIYFYNIDNTDHSSLFQAHLIGLALAFEVDKSHTFSKKGNADAEIQGKIDVFVASKDYKRVSKLKKTLGTLNYQAAERVILNDKRLEVLAIPFNTNASTKRTLLLYQRFGEKSFSRSCIMDYQATGGKTFAQSVESKDKMNALVTAYNLGCKKYYSFSLNKGRITDYQKQTLSLTNLRTTSILAEKECDMDAVGNCAGTKLEDQGFFEATACFISFIPCMAAFVGDCIYELCIK